MISSIITLNSPNTSFWLTELVRSIQHCQREGREASTVSHNYTSHDLIYIMLKDLSFGIFMLIDV